MPPVKKQRIAPKVNVDAQYIVDERAEIVSQFAPECDGASSAFSAFFGDPEIPVEYYERRGYTPVTSPKGEQVTHKGDPLFKRPRESFQKEMDVISGRAMRLAESAKTAGDHAYAEGQLQEIAD